VKTMRKMNAVFGAKSGRLVFMGDDLHSPMISSQP
jgi:hypothetical protein